MTIKSLIRIFQILLLSCFTFGCSSISIVSLPTANAIIKVVNEHGEGIVGAKANVTFSKPKGGGQGWGEKSNSVNILTDANGMAEFSGTTTSHIYYGASKEGYYSSSYHLKYKKVSGVIGFRTYLPDNPILTVVLKKKINPAGLYARAYKAGVEALYLPKTNISIGFDLIEGDWVVPFGKGTHKDFVFKLTGENTAWNKFDVTMELSFSNEGDGILIFETDPLFGSKLRLPHNAPTDGYVPNLNQRYASVPEKMIANDFPENRNYFFRVRTKLNNKNNIVSALYGKIHGNIQFAKNGLIRLSYYINANENDTNLEFDLNNNLFKNLNKRLKVDQP